MPQNIRDSWASVTKIMMQFGCLSGRVLWTKIEMPCGAEDLVFMAFTSFPLAFTFMLSFPDVRNIFRCWSNIRRTSRKSFVG